MKLARLLEQIKEQQKKQAVGAFIYSKDTKCILLQLRSDISDDPLTWGCVGGGMESGESKPVALRREVKEETGYTGTMALTAIYSDEGDNLIYHTYIGVVPEQFEPVINHESVDLKWFEFGTWPQALHPKVAELLQDSAIQDQLKKVCK